MELEELVQNRLIYWTRNTAHQPTHRFCLWQTALPASFSLALIYYWSLCWGVGILDCRGVRVGGAAVPEWNFLAWGPSLWGIIQTWNWRESCFISLCGGSNFISLLHVGPECSRVPLNLSEPFVSECSNLLLCKEWRKLVFVVCLMPDKTLLSPLVKSNCYWEELGNVHRSNGSRAKIQLQCVWLMTFAMADFTLSPAGG